MNKDGNIRIFCRTPDRNHTIKSLLVICSRPQNIFQNITFDDIDQKRWQFFIHLDIQLK